jgi:hypothetical protein
MAKTAIDAGVSRMSTGAAFRPVPTVSNQRRFVARTMFAGTPETTLPSGSGCGAGVGAAVA